MKKLNQEERILIEVRLKDGWSLKDIAKELNRSLSTISREIKRNRMVERNVKIFEYNNIKTDEEILENNYCNLLKQSPYVCNNCPRYFSKNCTKHYIVYKSIISHKKSLHRRTNSRITESKIMMLKEIQRLLDLNQTIFHISEVIKIKYPKDSVSVQTIYSYINNRLLIKMNKRKRRKVMKKIEDTEISYLPRKSFLNDREYKDFEEYRENHKDISVVEMDLICGPLGANGYILTIFITDIQFLMAYKLEKKSQIEIVKILDNIERAIGTVMFRKMFEVILIDRGYEFSSRDKMERSIKSDFNRTRVFYCDKAKPNQKPNIENIHRIITRFLPKGISFNNLTQDEIYDMVNNINSLYKARYKKTPNDMFTAKYGQRTLQKLSLRAILCDSVNLNPIR